MYPITTRQLSLAMLAAFVLMAMVTSSAIAEVPQVISYQGRLLGSGGSPVPDGPQLIQFIIYDDSTGGSALWTSGFHSTSVEDGLFSVLLGASPHPPLPDNLFGGDFFSPDTARWLGIQVGVDPEISPRTKFTSSAYAYQALRADTAEAAYSVIGQNIGTNNLIDGAVTSEKLAPGVASRVGLLHTSFGTTSTTSTSPVTMQSFFVDAPGPGKLLLIASGQFYMNLDAASSSSLTASTELGLCDSPDTDDITSCGESYYLTYFQDADNASFTNVTKFFTITRYFDIGSAGIHTFYLNGNTSHPSYTLNLYGDIRYSAVWAPEEIDLLLPLKSDGTAPVEPAPSTDQNQQDN